MIVPDTNADKYFTIVERSDIRDIGRMMRELDPVQIGHAVLIKGTSMPFEFNNVPILTVGGKKLELK